MTSGQALIDSPRDEQRFAWSVEAIGPAPPFVGESPNEAQPVLLALCDQSIKASAGDSFSRSISAGMLFADRAWAPSRQSGPG
jgi:hypothetical protein